MNKSFCTNLVAVLVILLGYFTPVYKEQILSIGFFALSGAITNWIAVYMLFEKVPFLYGSGVIQLQFQEFKIGIKTLIMSQFFSDENVDRFFQGNKESAVAAFNFDSLIQSLDFDSMFEGLLDVIKESQFGGMLSMVGGVKALEPMRAPFKDKVSTVMHDVVQTEAFLQNLEDQLLPSHMSEDVSKKIENIVDQRLEELTPKMVKVIIEDMIAKHLGWLVVWGGVFGGLIGLLMSYVG